MTTKERNDLLDQIANEMDRTTNEIFSDAYYNGPTKQALYMLAREMQAWIKAIREVTGN